MPCSDVGAKQGSSASPAFEYREKKGEAGGGMLRPYVAFQTTGVITPFFGSSVSG